MTDRQAALWDQLATRSIELAPYRSDVLAPYLSSLLMARRLEDILKLAARIRAVRERDPIALYFQGAVLTQLGDPSSKQQGLALIAAALDNGVTMYMQIPQWLSNSVRPYRSRLGEAAVPNTELSGEK